jgi:hypothetical protein
MHTHRDCVSQQGTQLIGLKMRRYGDIGLLLFVIQTIFILTALSFCINLNTQIKQNGHPQKKMA